MKKLLVTALVLSLTLPAGAAFAKSHTKKKEAPKKWECTMGDKKIMTASLDECMKKGGMVMNYPGPDKAAPKAAKPKKK